MAKEIVVIAFENLYRWQSDALLKLIESGYEINLFTVPTQSPVLPLQYRLLKKIETKLLKSPSKNFTRVNVESKFKSIHKFKNLEDVKSYFLNLSQTNVHSVLVLIENVEEKWSELSNVWNVPIVGIGVPELSACFLNKDIISHYKKGNAIYELQFLKYHNGQKYVVYSGCTSIENGLLVKTLDAISAKCRELIVRYFNGKLHQGLTIDPNVRKHIFQPGLLRSLILHLWKKVYYKRQWFLLIQLNENIQHQFVNSFIKLLPPKDKFWADPFAVPLNDNKVGVFYEELKMSEDKGYLAYGEYQNGKFEEKGKVLELDYHLSFPFIFNYQDKLYMIPESMQSNSIQLWECESFPLKWKHKMNLFDNIKAVDTVIEKIKDKWWLFCTMKSAPDTSGNEDLYVFYSDNPFSNNWAPHPKNPVISDARLGRNAGKLEIHDGKIYRYGQYSGEVYGKALAKSEITLINENEYQERLLEVIYPDPKHNISHIHTYNRVENVAVSDGLRNVKRFF